MKQEGWINIYTDNEGKFSVVGDVFDSKQECIDNIISAYTYVTTTKIKWNNETI